MKHLFLESTTHVEINITNMQRTTGEKREKKIRIFA